MGGGEGLRRVPGGCDAGPRQRQEEGSPLQLSLRGSCKAEPSSPNWGGGVGCNWLAYLGLGKAWHQPCSFSSLNKMQGRKHSLS